MSGPQYDFDAVRQLAGKWGTQWDEKSTDALKNIRTGKLDTGDFGQAEAATAFGHLYVQAHEAYVATVEGIKKDLADFQAKLKAAADSMERRDGDAAAVLQGLANRWSSDDFHSDRELQTVRENQGKQDGGQGSTDGGSTDAPSTTDAAPATDTSATDAGGQGADVYGGSPTTPPPADDGDANTQSYSASQNPYANNKPS